MSMRQFMMCTLQKYTFVCKIHILYEPTSSLTYDDAKCQSYWLPSYFLAECYAKINTFLIASSTKQHVKKNGLTYMVKHKDNQIYMHEPKWF